MPTYRVEYRMPGGGIRKTTHTVPHPLAHGHWITVTGVLLHIDRVLRAMGGDAYDGTLLCSIVPTQG